MWPLPKMHWTSQYSPPPQKDLPLDMGPHCTETFSARDIWWPSLETCSNLFTSGAPPPHCSTWGQSKWVVRILLECFLVITSSSGGLVSMAIVMLTRAILF